MRKVPKIVWSLLACVVCIVATAAVCLMTANKGNSSDKYLEILNVINSTYYKEVDLSGMEDASAAAMVAALGDESSYYMTQTEYEEYKLTMTNQYVGIGVTTEFNERFGYLAVITVTPGSPADQAHIKIGNMIASVNDINVSQYSPEQLNELLRSFDENEKEEDKYFTIRLLNSQGGKADVKLKCELIYAEPVFYTIIEDTAIGYVQIKNFDDSSAASFKTVMDELSKMGAQAVIIDVRNNVSGKPGELSEVLDTILPKGDMFLLRDRSGKETTYSSDNSSLKIPMVVMVNENTACAAEIFASVMQQAGYQVVGRRTAANAQSQTIVELSDGSAVRLSRYEYLTPDKKSMADLGGVSPDVVSYQIEDSDMDVQLEAALDVLE
jgi:Periplasmic protease